VTGSPRPALSIIVATPGTGGVDLGPLLRALADSLVDESLIELLVMGSGRDESVRAPTGWTSRWLATPTDALVPDQWGVGLRAATAPLVAFLTPDCLVMPGWWRAASAAIAEDGVAGAAGGIDLAREGRPSAGVYLARYSAFLPRPTPVLETRADLPGEVTIYRREALLAYPQLAGGGFWEVRFHSCLLADGWRLAFIPEALAVFHGRPGVVEFMQQRCRHATIFGSERVSHRGESRLALVMKAPMVPVLLVARILRRALANRSGRRAIVRGLGPLCLFALAWAAGEARGALGAKPAQGAGVRR